MNKAEKMLHGLLDRHEKTPERKRGITQKIVNDGLTADQREIFYSVLQNAAKRGAIKLEWGKYELAHTIQRVRVTDISKLYSFLKRRAAPDASYSAAQKLREEIGPPPAWIKNLIDDLEQGWRVQKAPYRLSPDRRDQALVFLKLLQAIDQGNFEQLDLRTFSRRAVGDSKAIETHASRLAEALRKYHDLPYTRDPMDTLAALGLQKFPQAILFAGKLRLEDEATLSAVPYIGLPADWVDQLYVEGQPRSVLTVENLASFNRHVREVRQGDDIVLFSSGYSSKAFQRLLKRLDRQLPAGVPFYHWGDIDPHGLRIFAVLERLIQRPLRPHLMNHDIAMKHGKKKNKAGKERIIINSDSAIHDLALFLAKEGYCLEQEELDPQPPLE